MRQGRRVYVPVRIYSRFLANRSILAWFLADTGADMTLISAADASGKVDFGRLAESDGVAGIGGIQKDIYDMQDVLLKFTGANGTLVYRRLDHIHVAKRGPGDPDMPMPSLLGTDMLSRLKFTYGPDPALETR